MKVTLKDLQEVISDKHDIDENDIELDDKLTDLGLDSIDVVELVMELEVKFKLVISDDAYESDSTINDFLDILNKD